MDSLQLVFSLGLAFKAGVSLMLCLAFWLISKEKNTLGNIYLSLCFFAYASFSIYDSLGTIQFLGIDSLAFEFLTLPIFLIPIGIYLATYHYAIINAPVSKWVGVLFIPFVFRLYSLFFLSHYLDRYYRTVAEDAVLVLFLLIAGVISLLQIRKHQKNIRTMYSNIESIDLSWVYRFIIGYILIRVMSLIIAIDPSIHFWTVLADLADFVILLYLAYHGISQKAIYPVQLESLQEIGPPLMPLAVHETSTEVSSQDEEIKAQKQRILFLMDKEKPYLHPDLTLPQFARLTSMKPNELSHFLNQYFEESFYAFVNRYRVERSKEILIDPKYTYLNMLGVAHESGFNSKTAFNTNFKKLTQLTPSAYKKANFPSKDVRLYTSEHEISAQT